MPDPDHEIKAGGRGGQSPRPYRGRERGGLVPPKFFWALQVSVWSKNKGAPTPGPSPGSDLKCAEQELNSAFIVNIGQMSHGILASSY